MLVVDDNKVIRQLIRVILESEGFEVVTAADGAECLEVVHQVQPDMITLDVVMPRLDGLRTAALLRADPRTRALPLLIVSGCTPEEVDSGSEVAVDGFLAKPFEPANLVRFVRRLLERGSGEKGAEEVSAGRAGTGKLGGGLGGLGDLEGFGQRGEIGGVGELGGISELRDQDESDGGAEAGEQGQSASGAGQGGRGAQGAGSGEAERAAWGSGA